MAALSRRSVNVIMLGRMGFIPAFDIQSRYARQHLDEMAGKPNARGEDTLLLVEHNPVYTVGVRNKNYTLDDVHRLKAKGAQFYTTNRGGLITFHGPGQLVAYPILNLTHFKPSMKWYVCQLEKTLVETLKLYGLTGRLTDQTGVWVEDRKIASIGLHGTRYVTTHGIALNCNNDLSWFKAITPCGLEGVQMTSLTEEVKANVSLEDATKPFLRAFQEVFDCDLEYRMLEKEDMKTLQQEDDLETTKSTSDTTNAGTDNTDSSTTGSGGGGGVCAKRMDHRVEIGVRQLSTLASSSSTSSSAMSSSSPLPSTSSPTTCSTVINSSTSPPSSSHSSFFVSSKDESSNNTNSSSWMDPKSDSPAIVPPLIKRMRPMW